MESDRAAEQPVRTLTLRVSQEVYDEIERIAESQGFTAGILARAWVIQRLRQELGLPALP